MELDVELEVELELEPYDVDVTDEPPDSLLVSEIALTTMLDVTLDSTKMMNLAPHKRYWL